MLRDLTLSQLAWHAWMGNKEAAAEWQRRPWKGRVS